MNFYNFIKCLIFMYGLFCVCYGSVSDNDVLIQDLMDGEGQLNDSSKTNAALSSTPPTTISSTTVSTTQKQLQDEGGTITTLTLIICCITVVYWFITIIISFVLCIKYMGSQKQRTPPPAWEELSNVEYDGFSDIPDEQNSKIQGIKSKMGKIVKRSDGKKQDGSGGAPDEFAM